MKNANDTRFRTAFLVKELRTMNLKHELLAALTYGIIGIFFGLVLGVWLR